MPPELCGIQSDIGRNIYNSSIARWGETHAVAVVGHHPSIAAALTRLARFANADNPVLITGETGTGKELFARGLYLLSRRNGAPFIPINCAQYQEGALIASELFGHCRGSFTGALTDHRGVFEAAHGGVVFLDEIGELTLPAQAVLLRTLSEGEIVRVGETKARRVDTRVVCATNRSLEALVANGRFRADLYYRIRDLHLSIPPVRDRGRDWEVILQYFLDRLAGVYRRAKRFSANALAALREHKWPGNVRELRGIVDTGFHISSSDVIELGDVADMLEDLSRNAEWGRVPLSDDSDELFTRMLGGETFWDVVYRPYMQRELSRPVVRRVIERGLRDTRGSYKRLLVPFRIPEREYLRFMDFLRHQRLKPED